MGTIWNVYSAQGATSPQTWRSQLYWDQIHVPLSRNHGAIGNSERSGKHTSRSSSKEPLCAWALHRFPHPRRLVRPLGSPADIRSTKDSGMRRNHSMRSGSHHRSQPVSSDLIAPLIPGRRLSPISRIRLRLGLRRPLLSLAEECCPAARNQQSEWQTNVEGLGPGS